MLLCGFCEKIMLIRVKQRKSFYFDLCPECRAKARESFRQVRLKKLGKPTRYILA